MRRTLTATLLLAALACTKKSPPAPDAAAKPPHADAAQGAGLPADAMPTEEEIKPVYADFVGPPLPLAQKLCDALHELPAVRRGACCKAPKSTALTGECVKVVSAALRSQAVTLDEASVARCAAAQDRAFAGCAWVGQWQVPLPAECEGLLQGHRKSGETCRSSLECPSGLRCNGVGPLDAGRCGPPRQDGQACAVAVDSLAVYARDEEERQHPECTGFCGHRKCEPALPLGGKCLLARQCGPGLHCDGQACVANPVAALGEKCVGGGCVAGARCVAGKCALPKPQGASCVNDYECLGGCAPQSHQCAPRCELQ